MLNISKIVNEFNTSKDPLQRYVSYDYCYNYFYKNQDVLLIDIEKSCAIIGFYLASWGMMRGSSFLLQKSYKYYEPLIIYIANLDDSVWDIDVIDYERESSLILQIYKDIKKIVIKKKQRDLVLVTKIMMGVLGISPAFDEYFCKTFKNIDPDKSRFTSFNKRSLDVIYNFYILNKFEIDSLSKDIKTIDFATGLGKYRYKQAKIIDMYGFNKSFKK